MDQGLETKDDRITDICHRAIGKKVPMMSLLPRNSTTALQPTQTRTDYLADYPVCLPPRAIVWNAGDIDFAVQIATRIIPGFAQGPFLASTSDIYVYPAPWWWVGNDLEQAPFTISTFAAPWRWAMPYETLLQVVTQGLAERSVAVCRQCQWLCGGLRPMKPPRESPRGASPGAGARGLHGDRTGLCWRSFRRRSHRSDQRESRQTWHHARHPENAHQPEKDAHDQRTGRHDGL